MPTRTLLFLALALAVSAGAAWLLLPEPAGPGPADEPPRLPAAAAGASAATDAKAGPAEASTPAGTLPRLGPAAAPIVALSGGEDCSVSDHVRELIEDLSVLRWSAAGHGTRRLEVRRLERFVLDAVGCGQEAETRAALLARLDDTPDERLQARLLIALLGLGGEAELPARWDAVALAERADVLLALAWDPQHTGHAAPLDCAQVDPFVAGEALLPLQLGRAPAEPLRAWLADALLESESPRAHGGPRDDSHDDPAVRDAAAVVLGVASDDWPAARDLLVEAVLRRPRQARAPLFMLLRDPSATSRQSIEQFRRRHGGFRGLPADDLEGHEHFAFELAEVEAAVRADELPDAQALAAALRQETDPDERLETTSLALARLVGGELQTSARATLSDGLCAALHAPSDPDSDWLELLALVRLHVHDRYQPQLSIGYDSEEPVDSLRTDERTEVFLSHLADEQPSQRRLAVMGLFGATDGDAVRVALASALETESDRGVASWIRLALIRL